MKVKTLISILEGMDADAEVYVMMQQHLPWECALSGVAVRKDFDDDTAGNQRAHTQAGTAPNDVFLVEGEQVRRGNKAAWGAARRG
ncbi:hypothetical protein [Myxococcus xanthus]|uniref:hypothetical protein n=1 Tax=Myxococcus xanthus TaxID=34 RepID=UPI001129282D|nr:hypothetical protein [Myxococcus xanthus]QDF03386.1 hypothetical protein BHS04_09215 [Myxococcus xanthus]